MSDFVLTLKWFCTSCGWSIVMDAPGFAGDGTNHYPTPDGSYPGGGPYPCGPLLARRVRERPVPYQGDPGDETRSGP